MQKYRFFSNKRLPSPINVALLNAALIKNIAIFYHYLNQEEYGASMQIKEKWKYCSHFDIFMSFGLLEGIEVFRYCI